jgi:hypothetical protein
VLGEWFLYASRDVCRAYMRRELRGTGFLPGRHSEHGADHYRRVFGTGELQQVL